MSEFTGRHGEGKQGKRSWHASAWGGRAGVPKGEERRKDCPGGPVVKAGDVGLISGRSKQLKELRSYMLPEQLSPRTSTTEARELRSLPATTRKRPCTPRKDPT